MWSTFVCHCRQEPEQAIYEQASFDRLCKKLGISEASEAAERNLLRAHLVVCYRHAGRRQYCLQLKEGKHFTSTQQFAIEWHARKKVSKSLIHSQQNAQSALLLCNLLKVASRMRSNTTCAGTTPVCRPVWWAHAMSSTSLVGTKIRCSTGPGSA